MELKWRTLFLYCGIAIFLEICSCTSGARVPKNSARALAQKTGAAHFEEHYEKVTSSEENHQLRKRASNEDDFDYEVYQGVVGRPGIDFPILPRIPQTSFSCRTFGNGYFADLETECQVFHICDDGRKISFLCPNGTIFQQSELICDWWFKVNCPASPGHYLESSEMLSRAQDSRKHANHNGGNNHHNHHPSFTKKTGNEFYSNGNSRGSSGGVGGGGHSRNSFNDKNQYPIKKDNRKFESTYSDQPNHHQHKGKVEIRYESDEFPSLENFDFEDISDSKQKSKQHLSPSSSSLTSASSDASGIDSNDSEMQDVAESASFLGNNLRRNGFNYDTENDAKNGGSSNRKGFDRPKSDRGRQRYRGESVKASLRARGKDVSDSRGDEFSGKNGSGSTETRFSGGDKENTFPNSTTRQRQQKKLDTESYTAPNLIHYPKSGSGTQSGKDRLNTTPRRLDNTRTTPYYTPTVPTVRLTNSNDKTDSPQLFPTTTLSPQQSPEFGSNIHQVSKSKSRPYETNKGEVSVKTGQPGIISSFAVSGPPAITIPPPSSASNQQTSRAQDSRQGISSFNLKSEVKTPEKSIKTSGGISANSSELPRKGSSSGTSSSGTFSSGTPSSGTSSSETFSSGTPPPGRPSSGQSSSGSSSTESSSSEDENNTTTQLPVLPGDYSTIKVPIKLAQDGENTLKRGKTKFVKESFETTINIESTTQNLLQTTSSTILSDDFFTTSSPDLKDKESQTGKKLISETNANGYSYKVPTEKQESSITSENISSRGRGTFGGDKDKEQNATTDTNKFSPFTIKTTEKTDATSTPLVIGMRGTLPTDLAYKSISENNSPVITVNILSDGTYSSGKSPSTSSKLIPNSITSESLLKASTFKPQSTTSAPTYLSRDTTTVRPTSAGPTYLPKDVTTVQPSSSGPTYLPKPTTASSPLNESISDNVEGMIKTLNELKTEINIKKDDAINANKNREGLEIPPSSGPETLHSLALYFAGEDSSTTTEKEEPPATIQADINAIPLRNKTVQSFEALFGLSTTEKPTEPTLPPNFQPNIASNDLEAQNSNHLLGNAAGKSETRKIAQVFTNALSAYLEDPVSFRKILTEVHPTEPPSTEENEVTTQPRTTNLYFNRGTAASYLPTAATTISPPTTTTTTDDLEVLDFSDVTISPGQRAQFPSADSTITESSPSGGLKTNINIMTRIPASVLAAARDAKQGKKLHFNENDFTTESNQIAVEINKGLRLSTDIPYLSELDKNAETTDSSLGSDLSTTSSQDSGTSKPNIPLNFDLLPPVSSSSSSSSIGKDLDAPTLDILPPGYDDDEDTLQRAQSQSFVSPRNRFNNDDDGKKGGKSANKSGTKVPGHYITRVMSSRDHDISVTTENSNPWFLDPLTINDGLMDEFKTTTASPYTYLPKVSSSATTTEISPVHLDLSSMLIRVPLDSKGTDRFGKALAGIPDDLLPPENGMQRIANKVFGSLNETSADHLMNVMKKAEDNPTVRRLILLLIQTCGDDDYSKTVEQSRQALLNALIGMDSSLELEDEIEVIKLNRKQNQNRRGKSIGSSDQNSFTVSSTSTAYPVTTFRRILDLNSLTTTTTGSPSATDSSISTTDNPLEDTTRFEIRVEDTDELTSTLATTTDTDLFQLTTTTGRSPASSKETTTITNSGTDSSVSTTPEVLIASAAARSSVQVGATGSSSRRKAKDVEDSLSQSSSNFSHKSSDERALELLKSLYSLAAKFGRR